MSRPCSRCRLPGVFTAAPRDKLRPFVARTTRRRRAPARTDGGTSRSSFRCLAIRHRHRPTPSGFPGDGVVTKVIGSGARAYSLALQVREGKVTLAGRVEFDFAFARYTATGTLEDESSHRGFVLTDRKNFLGRGQASAGIAKTWDNYSSHLAKNY